MLKRMSKGTCVGRYYVFHPLVTTFILLVSVVFRQMAFPCRKTGLIFVLPLNPKIACIYWPLSTSLSTSAPQYLPLGFLHAPASTQ